MYVPSIRIQYNTGDNVTNNVPTFVWPTREPGVMSRFTMSLLVSGLITKHLWCTNYIYMVELGIGVLVVLMSFDLAVTLLVLKPFNVDS